MPREQIIFRVFEQLRHTIEGAALPQQEELSGYLLYCLLIIRLKDHFPGNPIRLGRLDNEFRFDRFFVFASRNRAPPFVSHDNPNAKSATLSAQNTKSDSISRFLVMNLKRIIVIRQAIIARPLIL